MARLAAMKYQKIVLLGYMGCGKSTVGKLLAQNLQIPFYDLDQLIEEEIGGPLSTYFQKQGELKFRALEHQLFEKTLAQPQAMVLALGGGTPCYYDHMDTLSRTPGLLSIYLQLPLGPLTDRLFKERAHRPLIADIAQHSQLLEFVGKHLFERTPYYKKATLELALGKASPEAVVQKILAELA